MIDDADIVEVDIDEIMQPDDKGRMPLGSLDDRELLLEIASNSRKVADLAEEFFKDLRSGKINMMSLFTGLFKG